jgi:hypothetical protein
LKFGIATTSFMTRYRQMPTTVSHRLPKLFSVKSRSKLLKFGSAMGLFGACIGLALLSPAAAIGQTPKAKAKGGGQVVNPAPVTYWMDVSTGATASGGGMGGLMGGMMGGMAARGAGGGSAMGGLFGGRDNWFGAAQTGIAGRFTDIAIYDRRQPGRVTATQAVPDGLRLGPTIPLLPPPPPAPQTKNERTPWDDREPESTPEMPRFQIKFYWGCGAQVRAGQPRVLDFTRDNMAAWGQFMQGRVERDRGATSNRQSSFWPNTSNSRKHATDGSLIGDHTVTGAGLPASLNFQIGAAQDFMPPLGLRTEGGKAGVINLSWSTLPTATGYFANATGFSMQQGQGGAGDEMTMVLWSAADVPDPGGGLIGYLNNANQDRFLSERAILPTSQTSCQIPSGIFAQSMMVNIGAVAYGRELNLVYPARPTDPRVAWNQEWTARVRVKSQASAMIMDGMGGAMSGRRGAASSPPRSSDPQVRAQQEADARRRECEAARSNGQSAGSDVGQAAGGGGGWRGALAGRALGALAGRAAGSRTANCDAAPAEPKAKQN